MEYRQCWNNVLFLHWTCSAETLQRRIPAPLQLATFQGQAWVSVILFRLRVRPRWLPYVPGVSNLVELNVRTYVHYQGRTGIWFLGVYADNRLAVRLARWLTPIPYERRSLRYEGTAKDSAVRYQWRPDSFLSARPVGPIAAAAPGSLDEWLLELYRLFAAVNSRRLEEAEVVHPRWLVQPVEVEGAADEIGQELGLSLSRSPEVTHYSPGVRAEFARFRRIGATASNRSELRPSRASLPPAKADVGGAFAAEMERIGERS
ncbi:MAG: DUF2071 domain-containing protein [Pirellulales bacterium]